MNKKNLLFTLTLTTLVLMMLLAAAFLWGLLAGSVSVPPSEVISLLCGKSGTASETHRIILLQVRLPRLILAALTGAALAMAGTTFQGLLRNPLADPYVIGTSSGAALGATISMVLGLREPILGISPIPFFAFAGALVSMFLVYTISRRNGKVPMDTFLLAGVIVGSFMGALVSCLMACAKADIPKIVFWLMGSFSGREEWINVLLILPYLVVGSLVLYRYSHSLNLIAMGEDAASHKGVDVERTKVMLIISASLITASAVSVSGLIGFVGLMIPHMMRHITGPDHRILIPASALAGAFFLMSTDTFARTVLSPQEIPVGVITALLGAPFFLYLLRGRKAFI
ncbi:MAG: FecCD family ABC transporter permease [Candidatus Xenobiia bacterium LiM19]